MFVLLVGVGIFVLGCFSGANFLSFQLTLLETEPSDKVAGRSGEWQEELLRPEDISAIKAQWLHLTELTTTVLDEMLATRNDKIKRCVKEPPPQHWWHELSWFIWAQIFKPDQSCPAGPPRGGLSPRTR